MHLQKKMTMSILVLTFSMLFAVSGSLAQSPLVSAEAALAKSTLSLVEYEEVVSEPVVQVSSTPSQPYSATISEEELLGRLVQHEVGNCSIEHKRIVAQVVINRVRSSRFKQNTIRDVIYAPGQFSGVSAITQSRWAPDAETRQAVHEVLTGTCADNSQGALYFYNPRYTARSTSNWFENDLQFLFELEGHRFFK